MVIIGVFTDQVDAPWRPKNSNFALVAKMMAESFPRRLVAGVLFDGLNGANVWMHVAAKPGARWMTRDYLRAAFAYPFKVCGVQRISGYVDASNQQARRFDEHLGFQQEAVLKGAASDGGDVLVYVMWRNQCRFL